MRAFYLDFTTLLLISLGLLEVATFPAVPVGAPPTSSAISDHDAGQSNPIGAVDGVR